MGGSRAIGKKRVARLMRAASLAGASRRRRIATTRRDPAHHPASDLVRRNFAATGPNQLWVADITFIPTLAGFLFLAVVLDAWSRRIVGGHSKLDAIRSLKRYLAREVFTLIIQRQ